MLERGWEAAKAAPAVGLQPGVHLFPLFFTDPPVRHYTTRANGTRQAESTQQRSELLTFLPSFLLAQGQCWWVMLELTAMLSRWGDSETALQQNIVHFQREEIVPGDEV